MFLEVNYPREISNTFENIHMHTCTVKMLLVKCLKISLVDECEKRIVDIDRVLRREGYLLCRGVHRDVPFS